MLFKEHVIEDPNTKEAEVVVIAPSLGPEDNIPWLDGPIQGEVKVEVKPHPPITREIHLVIDADSLIYQAAHIGDKNFEPDPAPLGGLFSEGVLSVFDEQVSVFASRVSSITFVAEEALRAKGIGISHTTMLFTPKYAYREKHNIKPNFRYPLVHAYNEEESVVYELVNKRRMPQDQLVHTPLPGYKANRVGLKSPVNTEQLLEYVLDTYDNSIACDGCEADDYAYKMKMDDLEGVMLAIIDKDILGGTPSGELGHLNFNKGLLIYTSVEEANLFYYRQCLTGDSTDGIPGIYGCGPVNALKTVPKWVSHETAWEQVMTKYTKAGYTEEYAVLMMRLVNLNQLTAENNISLWQPPYGEVDSRK